ncbi:MAG: DUF4185 domain-containing protein [Acidobacteriia bacterium]|nr:DUF4185 domain-containing protein [Terriglobia bacterium]
MTVTAIMLFLLSSATSLHAQEKFKTDCTPNFPFKQLWWGADAAYSIPLPDGRSVWIFGDTLYGDRRVVEGSDPRMVRNSIGISTCGDRNSWKVDYVVRRGDKGQPQDFFQAQHKGTWYWALDGFFYKNDLWVTLLCIRNAPKTTSAALGFETCGADLARVSGLEKDPQRWSVKYFPLVPDGVHAYPSATVVVEGDYVYIFALQEADLRPMLLTRIPLDGLDSPADHLQYLSKSGNWKPGLTPANAMHVMKQGNTEMTVRYHPGLKEWIAILNYPKLFSDLIIARTAPRLEGPWSEEKVIYRIPEMQKGSAGYDKDTFCYAAKEHPEFRQPGSLLITYACNTMNVQKLASDLDIYFPKVVRVPFP